MSSCRNPEYLAAYAFRDANLVISVGVSVPQNVECDRVQQDQLMDIIGKKTSLEGSSDR